MVHRELAADKEATILSAIEGKHNVCQRDLSRVIGMSLGMTNAIIKRLASKGFLVVQKINNRNIAYAVTPMGIEAIAKRSYRYFRRTINNIVNYREAIEAFVRDVRARGYEGIKLAGVSDLDFVVEHACRSCGMMYMKEGQSARVSEYCDRYFLLYSENVRPGEGGARNGPATAFLQDVVGAVSTVGNTLADQQGGGRASSGGVVRS